MLTGCGQAPLAEKAPQGPKPDACLKGVAIDALEQAIRRCDAVVAAHPQHPQPRNDRALLLSLAGRNAAACRDSLAASALLAKSPRQPAADPLLVEEIEGRRNSCEAWSTAASRPGLTSPPAGDAPSAAEAVSPGR